MTRRASNAFLLGFAALLILAAVILTVISTEGGAPGNQGTITAPALTEPQATPSSVISTAPKDPTLAPIPPTIETPVFPAGIFEGGEGVFQSTDVTIYNRWQGYVNGKPAQVFAGALFGNTEQGVIIPLLAWSDGTVYSDREIVRASGPLQIVSEENLRLVISSASGVTFYYDIPGMELVDSFDAPPLPTVTRPAATETSAPPLTAAPPTAYP